MTMRIDVHTHILPENWPDLRERYGYGGFIRLENHAPCRARMMIGDRFFREIQDNCWSPARRIEDCNRTNVTVQVLSTVPVMFSYWAKPADGHDLARFLNDHIANVVAEHPTRFAGLGTVPLQAPELAVKELERCLRELGLAGVQIGTHINGKNLDEPGLGPFFECAAELGAAVFVHPWDMLAPGRMDKYWTPWLVGMPTESCLAICSVIFGGILERLPKLRIGFAHGGGSFAGTFGRIEHGFHARPDLCGVANPHSPRQYLGRFYVDSLVHDTEVLRQLVRMMGIEKIFIGSDYPFPLGEAEPGRLIESLTELAPAERDRLFFRNALDYLGVSPKRFGLQGH